MAVVWHNGLRSLVAGPLRDEQSPMKAFLGHCPALLWRSGFILIRKQLNDSISKRGSNASGGVERVYKEAFLCKN